MTSGLDVSIGHLIEDRSGQQSPDTKTRAMARRDAISCPLVDLMVTAQSWRTGFESTRAIPLKRSTCSDQLPKRRGTSADIPIADEATISLSSTSYHRRFS